MFINSRTVLLNNELYDCAAENKLSIKTNTIKPFFLSYQNGDKTFNYSHDQEFTICFHN